MRFGNSISNCCFQHSLSAFDMSQKSRALPECLKIPFNHTPRHSYRHFPVTALRQLTLCGALGLPYHSSSSDDQYIAARSRPSAPVHRLSCRSQWLVDLSRNPQIAPETKCQVLGVGVGFPSLPVMHSSFNSITFSRCLTIHQTPSHLISVNCQNVPEE